MATGVWCTLSIAVDAASPRDIVDDSCLPVDWTGERRIVVYRYAPAMRRSRFSYRPSAELLARLTPERAAIVSRGSPPQNLAPTTAAQQRNDVIAALRVDELREILREREEQAAARL